MLAALAVLAAQPAASQEWRATARFGRVTYAGAPTGTSANSSVVLGIGRTSPHDWLGASAALPLGEDPFWAVLGGWRRLESRGTAGLLLDLSAQGFIQRHRATTSSPPAPSPLPIPPRPPTLVTTDRSGEGGGVELMAGGFVGSSTLRLESRAGVTAQRSRLGGVAGGRALPTGDARLRLALAPLTIQGETRAWAGDEATHGYVGGTIQYVPGPVQVWGSLGRWVAGGHDHLAWSAGAGAEVGPGVELQLGGRGHAFDPLYLSTTETSFWAGLSLRLGGSRTVAPPVPGRARDGQAVIGIQARATRGMPSIAGDFTDWKPVPMMRAGSRWIYTARLAPGVYHYAFVAEDGTWFVPESVPGRKDDGMGGQVAVLVVS